MNGEPASFGGPIPRKRLVDAAAAFIREKAQWQWWITLTFKSEVSRETADRILKQWLGEIAKNVVRGHVWFAWGREEQSRGVLHYHVLLSPDEGSGELRATAGKRAWKIAHPLTGHATMKRYDPEQPAARYLADHLDWDVNVACPRVRICRRARGCLRGPAW